MRVKQPGPATVIMTLQFDRTEYVHDRAPRGIKMYIDDAASGVTVAADRPPATNSAIVNWDQYIPRFDPNFDLDRPYWKDRNTRLSEVLDLQRRREHICTLTNKATANFAGPKASFTAADGLPDKAWTLFGANGSGGWELVSGQNVLNAEETALVVDRPGTYELHFNIYHQTTKPIAFIVAGQSNARGWLNMGVAGDAHFSGTKQWSYGQYYNGSSWVDWPSTGLIDATLPLHHPDSRYPNAIGFDMQFSHEHGYSDVIFIPCAHGGAGFGVGGRMMSEYRKNTTLTSNTYKLIAAGGIGPRLVRPRLAIARVSCNLKQLADSLARATRRGTRRTTRRGGATAHGSPGAPSRGRTRRTPLDDEALRREPEVVAGGEEARPGAPRRAVQHLDRAEGGAASEPPHGVQEAVVRREPEAFGAGGGEVRPGAPRRAVEHLHRAEYG